MALFHASVRWAREHKVLLKVLHVNHHLQPESNAWACQVSQQCHAYDVDIQLLDCPAKTKTGQLETWAREQRYQLFEKAMGHQGVLMLAHHQNDQAETLLSRMLRGSGPIGLSSMDVVSQRQGMTLWRPWLDVDRKTIRSYAKAHHLNFIEDPSNQDIQFERNFIRHKILPMMADIKDNPHQQLANVADHCRDMCGLVDDLMLLMWPNGQPWLHEILDLSQFSSFSQNIMLEIFRRWLMHWGHSPTQTLLKSAKSRLFSNNSKGNYRFVLGDFELRQYRQKLYRIQPDQAQIYDLKWDGQLPLELPGFTQPITLDWLEDEGLEVDKIDWSLVHIRSFSGRARSKIKGSAHHQLNKKICQARAIPAWDRSGMPMICQGGHILMVLGGWVCELPEESL